MHYIGIDLGGTNVRVGIFDDKNNLINVIKEKSIHDDKDELYKQIKKMLINLDINKYQVKAIGVSLCGIEENGILTYAPNLNINGLDLKKRLEDDFHINVNMANDANAACLCEANIGNAKKYNHVLFTTISTGLGIGLTYFHKLINLPFEAGHQLITYQNKDYDVENLLSGTGIVKLAHLNNLEVSDTVSFFELIKKHDPKANKVLEDYVTLLAKFYYNQQVVFNVDCIILSGGVMKSKDLFYPLFIKKFMELIKNIPLKEPIFIDATYDQDAGLYGAYAVAKYF